MIKQIKQKIKSLIDSPNQRSKKAKKNIIALFIIRFLNTLISFPLVSLYILYLGKEKYGIWITISSILTFVGYTLKKT